MARLLAIILGAAAIIAAFVWLAEHPGEIQLAWGVWRVETSLAVALIALVLAISVLIGLLLLVERLVGVGKGQRRARLARRRRRVEQAVTTGLVALASGDAVEARRQAEAARSAGGDGPLVLLLSAQAAAQQGDGSAARRYFEELARDPQTALLGLRGLVLQAIRAGDREAAARHAEAAHRLSPGTPWVIGTLAELAARGGDWSQLTALLAEAREGRLIDRDMLARYRAIAALGEARAAEAAGEHDRAAAHATTAFEAAPGYLPAALARARIELARGGKDATADIVERAWRACPHPELARIYRQAIGGVEPVALMRRMERLARVAPDHAETHLALGEAAREVRIWGQARKHYEDARRTPEAAARALHGLAQIAIEEHGDQAAARLYEAEAETAPPAPFWHCVDCHGAPSSWQPICHACGAFDSVVWGVPGATLNAAAPAPAALWEGERESPVARMRHLASRIGDRLKPA